MMAIRLVFGIVMPDLDAHMLVRNYCCNSSALSSLMSCIICLVLLFLLIVD